MLLHETALNDMCGLFWVARSRQKHIFWSSKSKVLRLFIVFRGKADTARTHISNTAAYTIPFGCFSFRFLVMFTHCHTAMADWDTGTRTTRWNMCWYKRPVYRRQKLYGSYSNHVKTVCMVWKTVCHKVRTGRRSFRQDHEVVSISHITEWAEWQNIEQHWMDGVLGIVFQPLTNENRTTEEWL